MDTPRYLTAGDVVEVEVGSKTRSGTSPEHAGQS
jgi:hypothetical protein